VVSCGRLSSLRKGKALFPTYLYALAELNSIPVSKLPEGSPKFDSIHFSGGGSVLLVAIVPRRCGLGSGRN